MPLLDILIDGNNIDQEQNRNTLGTILDIVTCNSVIEEIPQTVGGNYEIGFGY